jgi:hypothetical protein
LVLDGYRTGFKCWGWHHLCHPLITDIFCRGALFLDIPWVSLRGSCIIHDMSMKSECVYAFICLFFLVSILCPLSCSMTGISLVSKGCALSLRTPSLGVSEQQASLFRLFSDLWRQTQSVCSLCYCMPPRLVHLRFVH